jgi:hypothetical protein
MRLFVLSALLAASSALADERFDKLDYDKDGKLSKAEAAGNADLIIGFDRNDRNRDGKLSVVEYERLTRPKTADEPKSATGSTSPPRRAKKK